MFSNTSGAVKLIVFMSNAFLDANLLTTDAATTDKIAFSSISPKSEDKLSL